MQSARKMEGKGQICTVLITLFFVQEKWRVKGKSVEYVQYEINLHGIRVCFKVKVFKRVTTLSLLAMVAMALVVFDTGNVSRVQQY